MSKIHPEEKALDQAGDKLPTETDVGHFWMGCSDLSWSPQGAGGVPSKAACGHHVLSVPRVPGIPPERVKWCCHPAHYHDSSCFLLLFLLEKTAGWGGKIQTISALAMTCKVWAWSKICTPQGVSKLRAGFRFRPISLLSVDFSSSAVSFPGKEKTETPKKRCGFT